ncbi:MAG TPA: nucleotide exchange factor GrpE [Gemmatimonadales bacterium]|nr:nucleotide exchange factor GrpE [Gemmatimonadales bacterium]
MRNSHLGKRHDPEPLQEQEGQPAAASGETVAGQTESTEAASGQGQPQPEAEAVQTALTEPLEEALKRLEAELSQWKDRALRAAADLENFRKRSFREREEAQYRGAGEVLARIVDVIDDLARVAHLDPATTDAAALHEGMLAIERKFLNALALSGLERIEPLGEVFDPQVSEAVATLPADSAEQDHRVGAVYQNGYRYRGVLLRPARVAVFQWKAAEQA